MCAFNYYRSQKYNLTTSCWRDLSYPSERTLMQEIIHRSVICECCLSTAAQGRPARFKTTVKWRQLALLKNKWEAFKQSFAAGTWKPHHAAEGSNYPTSAVLKRLIYTTRTVALYPFCKGDTSKHNSGTSLANGFKKTNISDFSVCNVTINSVLLCLKSIRENR